MGYTRRPTQRQIDLIVYINLNFGGQVENTLHNLKRICTHVGWNNHADAREAFFSLRKKGYVQSIGGSIANPEIWKTIDPNSEDPTHVEG